MHAECPLHRRSVPLDDKEVGPRRRSLEGEDETGSPFEEGREPVLSGLLEERTLTRGEVLLEEADLVNAMIQDEELHHVSLAEFGDGRKDPGAGIVSAQIHPVDHHLVRDPQLGPQVRVAGRERCLHGTRRGHGKEHEEQERR